MQNNVNYRVIKYKTGLMACRCSACTPKYTRILRFLPPSRPPNFYETMGQITVSIHFFTFSKLSMLHHKKSSKMHTSLSIFAILRFIESNQKHAFLLHFFSRQNRDSYITPATAGFCLVPPFLLRKIKASAWAAQGGPGRQKFYIKPRGGAGCPSAPPRQ